jgi:hypothetical protein
VSLCRLAPALLGGSEPLRDASEMSAARFVALAATIVSVFTLTLAAYTYGGAPLGVAAALTTGLAVLTWTTTTFRRPRTAPEAFGLYIACVVALIVLYAEQWAGHFATSLMHLFPESYPPGVGITDHAFVAVFPLGGSALLLLGALAYHHRLVVGRFCAWFTFCFGAVAALGVWALPLIAGAGMRYVPGMIAAPILAAIAILGMRRLLRVEGYRLKAPTLAPPRAFGPKPPLNRETKLSVALVAVFIPTYATVLYLQAGPMVVGIVCGAMLGGFIVWIRTTLRRPPAPGTILPAYLLGLALFLLHVLEEYAFDFAPRIAAAAHVRWTEPEFVAVIVLFGPAIWIAGTIGIYRRHPLGNYIAWFFFIGMILGEPAHMLVFPFLEGGRYHYFPGMWTALFPMVPAAYGIWRMISGHPGAITSSSPSSPRTPSSRPS